jgi:hypothetical protein
MTREEAAKILEKQFDESCGDYRYQNKDKLNYEDALWLAIAALREQREGKMEWISVRDRLPEDQVEVLVATRSKNGVRNIDKGYLAIDHFIHRGRAEVTHWMPMPEFPKEDFESLVIDDFSNPCPFCELEGKEVRKCGRRRALIRCGVVGNTEGECPYKGV